MISGRRYAFCGFWFVAVGFGSGVDSVTTVGVGDGGTVGSAVFVGTAVAAGAHPEAASSVPAAAAPEILNMERRESLFIMAPMNQPGRKMDIS